MYSSLNSSLLFTDQGTVRGRVAQNAEPLSRLADKLLAVYPDQDQPRQLWPALSARHSALQDDTPAHGSLPVLVFSSIF